MRKEIIIRMRPESDKCRSKALKVAAAVSGVDSVTVTGRDRNLLLVIGHGVDESKLTKKLRKEIGEADIVELRTLDDGDGTAQVPVLTAASNGKGVAVFAQSPYNWHPIPGRSVPGAGGAAEAPVLTAGKGTVAFPQSPYDWYPTPGRSVPGGGGAAEAPSSTASNGAVAFAQSPYNLHPTPGRSVPGGSRVMRPMTPAAASPVAARWPGEHSEPLYYPRTPGAYYYGQGERPPPMAVPVLGGVYGGSSYARAAARSHPANYSPMVERHDHDAVGREQRTAGRHRHGGHPNCCSIL